MRERRLLAALERGERSTRGAARRRAGTTSRSSCAPAAAMVMEAHLEKLEAEGRLPDDLDGLVSSHGSRRLGRRSAADRTTRVRRALDCLTGAAGVGRIGAAAAGAALAPARATPAAAVRGRRSRSTGSPSGRDPPRPLGRAPHRGRRPRGPLVRRGLLPRPGPALADGLLPAGSSRPGLGDRRARRGCRSTG